MKSQGSEAAGDVPPDKAQANAGGPLDKLKRVHASLMASNRWYVLLVEIFTSIQEHRASMLAQQAAYSLLYAVPSILVLLISLAAIIDKNTGSGISDTLQEVIGNEAPAELRPLLESLVQYALVEASENTAIVAFLISLGIALWSATGGVGAQIYALNTVYDIRDRRTFIQQVVVKIGLMLLGGLMVIAAFLLLAFGRLALELVPGISGFLAVVLSSSIPWAMALLLVALLMLYWFGLDTPKSFRWMLPGAIVATIAIGLVLALLDLILTYSNPGAAYGVAGSVLILLWTFFVLSMIVVIGAIVNSVVGRHPDPKLIAGLQSRPPELPAGKRIDVEVYR